MKPCPFCGSRARLQAYRKSFGGSWARAMCTNKACAARGPTIRREVRDVVTVGTLLWSELKAWAERAWNERAQEVDHVNVDGV
jgi:hypothetical protein